MILGNQCDVQPVPGPMAGARGVFIQWLVAQPQGAKNFYMRRIIVEEGGFIPDHSHSEEHEIYILTGEGQARLGDQTLPIGPGNFMFVPGGQLHGYLNTGPSQLTFICCITAAQD